MSRITKLIHWFAHHERIVLAGWLVIVTAAWGFIEVTAMVSRGSTQAFDDRVMRAMRRTDDPAVAIGPDALTQFARDITALGSYSTLIVVVLISVLFLSAARQRVALRTLAGASASGYLAMLVLKSVFQRPRPDVVPHLIESHSTSFPSGHAMMSAVIYVTLAFQLLSVIKHWQVRLAIMLTAILLTTLIGMSRIFLGVHFPTDVLAGWTAGLVWSLLWVLLSRPRQSSRGDPD